MDKRYPVRLAETGRPLFEADYPWSGELLGIASGRFVVLDQHLNKEPATIKWVARGAHYISSRELSEAEITDFKAVLAEANARIERAWEE